MPVLQTLLFPDPRPLVERLGHAFFRQLPQQPGVYLMHDAADAVLYVGKAKNLRKRLGSYRVANPDRMRRRHLRMLRAVARIELELYADESAALAREAELLQRLKPKFNRAGVWPATPQFLVWRLNDEMLEMSVTENPEPGWRRIGPMGSRVRYLRAILVRLVWRAVHVGQGAIEMPAGWNHGLFADVARVQCAGLAIEIGGFLNQLITGQVEEFCEWVKTRRNDDSYPFEQAAVADDIEGLRKAFPGDFRKGCFRPGYDLEIPGR